MINLVAEKFCCNFVVAKTSRGGAVVARWAHNPKVAGSSPALATKRADFNKESAFFVIKAYWQCR